MLRYLYILLFFLLVILSEARQSFPQSTNPQIDSLLSLLKKDKEDTSKVIHLNKLCWEYQNAGSYDTSLYYGNAALQLAKQLNFKKGLAMSYSGIGGAYHNQSRYEKALENNFAALKIREEIGDKKGIASSCNNIGAVYEKQGNYDRALENYFASLKIWEEINNKQGVIYSYINIGDIYEKQGNYTKALENYFVSLKTQKGIGDKRGIAYLYNNIGETYEKQGNYTKALENHFASLKIKEEIGDKQGITSSYINIGSLYNKKNNHAEAITYLQKGLQLSKEIGTKNLMMVSYQGLSETFENAGDYKNACQYYQLSSQIKDSLFNEESIKKIAEMQTKYDVEKKDKEIEIQALKISEQQLQLSKKNILQIFLYVGIVLIIVISFLLFNRNKIKQRERLSAELLKQQQEHTKAIIEMQEQERTRIARDLHDGIGQTLAGIKIGFEKLSDEFHFLPTQKQASVIGLVSSLDEAYKEVRTLSHQMMPRALKELNIENALSELLERTFSPVEIKYKFEPHNTATIPQQAALCLYRALQELLNNIIKHSQAKNISVQLLTTGENIMMLVQDDGVGIEADKISNGIGLKNISGRVQALNGTFFIIKEEHGGTIATIRIPLQKENIV